MAKQKLTAAHEFADALLAQIAFDQAGLDAAEEDLAAELARLKELSPFWEGLEERIAQWQERLQDGQEQLEALMKEHLADFFPGAASVPPVSLKLDLPHGDLLYSKEFYVVKGRKVLALLLKYGFEEALRRTVAVDWDALADVEEWPDEVLAIIGARRKEQEEFAWDLKEEIAPAPTAKGGEKAHRPEAFATKKCTEKEDNQ